MSTWMTFGGRAMTSRDWGTNHDGPRNLRALRPPDYPCQRGKPRGYRVAARGRYPAANVGRPDCGGCLV